MLIGTMELESGVPDLSTDSSSRQTFIDFHLHRISSKIHGFLRAKFNKD